MTRKIIQMGIQFKEPLSEDEIRDLNLADKFDSILDNLGWAKIEAIIFQSEITGVKE